MDFRADLDSIKRCSMRYLLGEKFPIDGGSLTDEGYRKVIEDEHERVSRVENGIKSLYEKKEKYRKSRNILAGILILGVLANLLRRRE